MVVVNRVREAAEPRCSGRNDGRDGVETAFPLWGSGRVLQRPAPVPDRPLSAARWWGAPATAPGCGLRLDRAAGGAVVTRGDAAHRPGLAGCNNQKRALRPAPLQLLRFPLSYTHPSHLQNRLSFLPTFTPSPPHPSPSPTRRSRPRYPFVSLPVHHAAERLLLLRNPSRLCRNIHDTA